MKIKVSELSGRPLDYAVAVALGGTGLWYDGIATWWIKLDGKDRALSKGWSESQSFAPSTDWNQGGPIIDREGIETAKRGEAWRAISERLFEGVYGPTLLIAAMRCFVVSKLGEEVEIPEGLQ